MQDPTRFPLYKPFTRMVVSTLGGLALSALVGQQPAQAAEPLPADSITLSVLQAHPQWRSLLALREADRAQARQTAIGDGEWTLDVGGGQRRYQGVAAGEPATREWSTSLSHPWRLPARRAADQGTAQALNQLGDAQLAVGWQALVNQLLDLQGEWLLARRQADLWQAQLDTAAQQLDATRKRVLLGDAARLDLMQAEAAHAQARAQTTASRQHLDAVTRRVSRGFPGWPLTAIPDAPDSWRSAQTVLASVPDTLDENRRQGLLQTLPTQQAAAARLAVSEQQARQADAARIASPTVGVGLARDRSGAEQAVLLQISWPLGGEYRSLAAQAQQARRDAASADLNVNQAQADSTLLQRWHDTRDAMSRWQAQSEALDSLEQAARALDKGYRMGEGQLDQVLQARRLAREQALQAAQAEAEAWLALWRWQLDSGARWTAPSP